MTDLEKRLVEALYETTEALGRFVPLGKRYRQPYEDPLSVYDRSQDLLMEMTKYD